MEYAALLQALVGAMSAGAGASARLDAEAKARELLERARNDFGDIDIPTLEQITDQELGPSAFSKIQTDAKLVMAQNGALDKLGEYADGGMTLQDQATLNAAMGKVARHEGAGRNAIKNDMQARGTFGSGAELAMSLKNQQDSADRASQMGMDAAGKAQQRALDAMISRGQMAGQMRGQAFNEDARKAEASDIIARYNATRGARGVKDLVGMRLDRARGMNGLTGQSADSARRTGDITAQGIGGVGSAVNQGIGAYATYKNNQHDSEGLEEAGQVEDEDYLARLRRQGP